MPSSSVERYLPPLNERTRRWLRFLGVIAGAWLIVWILTGLSTVLTPVVAALALAYILNPAVTWLEEKHQIARLTSVATGLVIISLLVAFGLLIGGVQLFALITQFLDQKSWEDIQAQVAGWPLLNQIESVDLPGLAQGYGAHAVGVVGGFLGSASYFATAIVLIPLYTFFFLLEFNHIVAVVHDHLPAEYRPTIVRIVTTIDRSIAAFFRGRVVVCSIIGFLTGLGWLIVGVKHSLLLGASAAVLNLVPFMSIAVVPVAMLIAYSAHPEAWLWPVTAAAAVYFIVQAIESFILTPTIESKSSGLHPVTTVIALLVGAQVAGLLGMLLAIPIASTLKSLGSEYVLPEIRRIAGHGERSEPEAAGDDAADSADADPSDAPDENGKTA